MNLSDVQIWRLRKEDVTSREHAAMNTVEIACNKTHMQLLYDLSTLIFFEYLILEDSGARYSECTGKNGGVSTYSLVIVGVPGSLVDTIDSSAWFPLKKCLSVRQKVSSAPPTLYQYPKSIVQYTTH